MSAYLDLPAVRIPCDASTSSVAILSTVSQMLLDRFAALREPLVARLRTPAHRRPSLPDFDVDPRTAFFPPEPLPSLPKEFARWEHALQEAPKMLSLGTDASPDALLRRASGERWRAQLRSWPVLDVRHLPDHRSHQRAHLVLAWLVHYFAHSMPPAADEEEVVIPAALAQPLVAVSAMLGIAPVLTFADTVLWNWEAIIPNRPLSIDNMHFVHNFSGTEDEQNFYSASARAELRGGELLRIIQEYLDARDPTSEEHIAQTAENLTTMTTIIEELSATIQSVRQNVAPKPFYELVRPWFVGSTPERPWRYEGVPGCDEMDLSGPSAGQSTVMHMLDVFLDIDHKLAKGRLPPPSENNKRADSGFMERMRRYMPGPHRAFLEYLEQSDRPLRHAARDAPALREPYNAVVKTLTRLRDLHIRIAALYIVCMSSSAPVCPFMRRARGEEARKSAKGTGGNEVSTLLKAGRDATRRAILQEQDA